MRNGRRRGEGARRLVAALTLAALAGCAGARAPAPDRGAPRAFLLTFWCGPPWLNSPTRVPRRSQPPGSRSSVRRARAPLRPISTGALSTSRPAPWPAPDRARPPRHPRGHHARPTGPRSGRGRGRVRRSSGARRLLRRRRADGARLRSSPRWSPHCGRRPARVAYVNLLPDSSPPRARHADVREDYVEQFVTDVQPPLLSFDYYPFGKRRTATRSSPTSR